MTILVVEDETNLARQMESYMNDLGHQCWLAHNKFSAIDQLLVGSFDILILDINLPDGSGIDLLKWIKEEKRKESVIIVSARDSLDDRILGLDLGAEFGGGAGGRVVGVGRGVAGVDAAEAVEEVPKNLFEIRSCRIILNFFSRG